MCSVKGDEKKFDQKQYDLLMECAKKGDMTEWNKWYEKYMGAQRNAGEKDCGIWLVGAILTVAHLEGADLSFAHLEDARLSGAHLEGARLSGAHLEGADLSFAHLEGARLSGAHLEGAGLFFANLEGADLSFAHLEDARLSGAHLEGADLSGANLEDSDLSGAHLEGARIFDSHLEDARLSGAHLKDAVLFDSHLEGADLSDSHLEGARMFESHLEGADLSGANLEDADLSGANLEDADLSGAHLKDANLFYAHLEGADLSGANLEGADLRRVMLKDVNMSKANLRSANVTWECLKVAKKLTAVTFPQLSISNEDLSNRDLSNTGLEGVTIENTNLKGTNFRFARVDGSTLIVGDPDKIIDDDTDFTGVGLSEARIDPKLRTRLERNIRKIQWEEWYVKPRVYPFMEYLSDIWRKIRGVSPEDPSNISSSDSKEGITSFTWKDRWKSFVVDLPIEIFWWLSDYGTKSKRCILAFIALNFVAFFAYLGLTWYKVITSDLFQTIINFGQLAGQTLLTMFGLGSLQLSAPWILLVALHAILGYFLLAVLITRFAIMFQSLSP